MESLQKTEQQVQQSWQERRKGKGCDSPDADPVCFRISMGFYHEQAVALEGSIWDPSFISRWNGVFLWCAQVA
jgi:hypothetical protein